MTTLRDNAAAIRRWVGDEVALMVMVKANGYGHGMETAATAAAAGGATWLGVANGWEAVALSGYPTEILNVGWTAPSEYADMIAAGIHMSVFDAESVRGMGETAKQLGKPAKVHVKIDTGMHRLGVPSGNLESVVKAIHEAGKHVRLTGIFTHFANADMPDFRRTQEQHAAFMAAIGPLKEISPTALVHCSNSGAALRAPEMSHDLVRIGIAFYGYPPETSTAAIRLEPAMTVSTTVARTEPLPKGTCVGYGGQWTSKSACRTATLRGGYGDGIPRSLGNRGMVLVNGQRCPVVGRVSMNFMTVDVTGAGNVRPGDEAILVGRQGEAELWADQLGASIETIPNEVLCALAPNLPRRVVEE